MDKNPILDIYYCGKGHYAQYFDVRHDSRLTLKHEANLNLNKCVDIWRPL